jgi:hypothetical protein
MKIKKYGIEITKPWSKEMYDHNDEVLSEVKQLIGDKWLHAYHDSENVYESNVEDHDPEFMESEWDYEANATLKDIQEAITITSYGSGFTVYDVEKEVHQELEFLPYWRAKEVAEDLSLKLDKNFIGLG